VTAPQPLLHPPDILKNPLKFSGSPKDVATALENTTDDAGVAPRKNDVGLNPRKM
jgi:hypothetical protein